MVLVAGGGAGGKLLYTQEEVLRTIKEPGWELPPEILQEREEIAKEEYLESEVHLNIVRTKLEILSKNYPTISFDSDIMDIIVNTPSEVRAKFDSLRELNMDLEYERMKNTFPENKGRNQHISLLLTFYEGYATQSNSFGNRDIEITLIKELPSILNKELGNEITLKNLGSAFVGGAIKPFTTGTKLLIKGATDLTKIISEDLFESFLGSEWKSKLVIGLVIAGVIGVGGLISYSYGKSYIASKARKRAEK